MSLDNIQEQIERVVGGADVSEIMETGLSKDPSTDIGQAINILGDVYRWLNSTEGKSYYSKKRLSQMKKDMLASSKELSKVYDVFLKVKVPEDDAEIQTKVKKREAQVANARKAQRKGYEKQGMRFYR